jgi:hypothetical protein
MSELNEVLSLVHELINSHGTAFDAGWRLYRIEALLHRVQDRYFLDDDDVAVLAEDSAEELVGELPDEPTPFDAA